MSRNVIKPWIAILGVVVLLSPGALRADPGVWYAKASNYGREDLTGKDEEHAWGTLQQAHDKASAGDTIYVLPGTYDQGSKKGNELLSRLVVSKQLHFVATGSAAETEIVGYRPGGGYNVSGSIRCVSVTSGGAGTTFTRFTLRGGGSGNGTKQPWTYNGEAVTSGGGLSCYGVGKTAWERAYLIDCVISNCGSTWGAAMYGGTAIRCLIKNNDGGGYGAAVCSAALWNSVVIGTKNSTTPRSAVGTGCLVVNSLIAAAASCGVGDHTSTYRSVCYNTLFTAIGSTAMQSGRFTNCVVTSRGVYSPATWDFRPVAGLEADGAGRTEYMTNTIALPEGLEMKDFNGNPIDLTKETCDIGAVQGTTPIDSGAIIPPMGANVDGKATPLYKLTYARAAGPWPTEIVLRPEAEDFLRYKATGNLCGGPGYRYPQRDGICRVIPSPTTSHNLTLTEQTYTVEMWCDPSADSSVATGEEEAPFATIQDAVVAATNALAEASGGAAVIRLKPGEYRDGGATERGLSNRMVLPSGYTIFVTSTDGAAATTVYGAADANPPEACYAGCGPDAVRCACLLGDSAVQGVTFSDGHSGNTGLDTDELADRVGGIYSTDAGQQILDCVVTNCTAIRGGAGYWGVFERCRFYDCVSYGGVLRYCSMSGCYVDASCKDGEGRASLTSTSVFGSSVAAVLCTAPNVSYYSVGAAYGTVFGDQKVYNSTLNGSVFRKATSVDSGAANYAVRDPAFVDLDGGDCRLATGTPAAAASAAALGARGSAEWNAWATAVAGFWQGDIDGNPIKVIDGAVLPGCCHTTVDGGVYVSAGANGGVAVQGGTVGALNFIGEGELAIAPTNGLRPCPGVIANGVTNLFDNGVSFTAADIAASGGGIFVEPFYTKDWYADPAGSDDACGFTPKTAKKTLAAAMAMTASGDTVHAAEGRYTEGVGSAKPGATHPDSRVYIPGNRTLVADGDADKTFIVGQIGTEHANSIGCGSNSVRCVYMNKSSRIKGFTLTDGSAYPAGSGTSDYGQPYNCGAVYGSDRDTCIVQDCIITNCAAYNGTAGREVAFVNCRIAGNKASVGITSECYHYGCIVDGNYAGSSSVYMHTRVVDTTVGPHAYKLNGKAGTALGRGSSNSAIIANSLILGPFLTLNVSITVSNCVMLAGSTMFSSTQNCVVATLDQVALDGNLRPIAGKSVACDLADASLRTSEGATIAAMVDALRKRANNGNRLDAGALEADWTERYAQDIGGRTFSVSAADNSVEETSTRTVLVPEGSSVCGAWRNGTGGRLHFLLRFNVQAGGSFDVTVDGSTKTFSEGLHEYVFPSESESASVVLASTAGTTEILGGKRLVGCLLFVK